MNLKQKFFLYLATSITIAGAVGSFAGGLPKTWSFITDPVTKFVDFVAEIFDAPHRAAEIDKLRDDVLNLQRRNESLSNYVGQIQKSIENGALRGEKGDKGDPGKVIMVTQGTELTEQCFELAEGFQGPWQRYLFGNQNHYDLYGKSVVSSEVSGSVLSPFDNKWHNFSCTQETGAKNLTFRQIDANK